MKSYIILAAVCFSGLALSAPNNYPTTTTTTTTKTTTTTTSSYYPEQTYCTKGQKFTRTTYDVNFDNIPSIPGVANNPIPSPYDQLYFQSWVNDDIIQSGVAPGTVPHSPPSKIATGANLQIQQGQPLFSTIYQNSNTTAFDLFSFYYDCQATTPEGVLGVPMQCDVIVTGYRGSTNTVANAYEVCSHTFTFIPPTNLATTNQAFTGYIPDCLNIQFATIDYFGTGLGSGLTSAIAASLDNLQIAAYSCT